MRGVSFSKALFLFYLSSIQTAHRTKEQLRIYFEAEIAKKVRTMNFGKIFWFLDLKKMPLHFYAAVSSIWKKVEDYGDIFVLTYQRRFTVGA